MWPTNVHENLHYDNEEDIHMSSENDEGSAYNLILDMLPTSLFDRVFHILIGLGLLE